MAVLSCISEKGVHDSTNSDEAVYCHGHVEEVK